MDAVITGTIFVSDRMATVFFDMGSTYPNISIIFSLSLDLTYDIIDAYIHVSTPVIEAIVVTNVYHLCIFFLCGFSYFGRFGHIGHARF